MEHRTLISIREFCEIHGIEHNYVLQLKEFGLIHLEEDEYIPAEVLPRVEKIITFNREMEINLEGIEVIFNLLDRLKSMDRRINSLQNRLRIYE